MTELSLMACQVGIIADALSQRSRITDDPYLRDVSIDAHRLAAELYKLADDDSERVKKEYE